MSQQIAIDSAFLHRQPQSWGKNIFKVNPKSFGIRYFSWHWLILINEQRFNTESTEASAQRPQSGLECTT